MLWRRAVATRCIAGSPSRRTGNFLLRGQKKVTAVSKPECNSRLMSTGVLEHVLEEDLCRGAPAQGLARTGVDLPGNAVELYLGVPAEVRALGQVLADQAVGVLVDPTLPRAVRV